MQEKSIMYVGCFTAVDRGGAGQGGIAVFERCGGGSWTKIQTVEQFNPSFLAMSEDERFLYGVQGKGNKIYAYAIDEHDGTLKFLNSVDSKAGLACEVCNGFLYVVAGEVQIYRLMEDGSIGELMQSFTPEGEVGPITSVQRNAQPHHILHDAQKKYFAVPCRGIDMVHVYHYDAQKDRVNEVCALDTYGGSYPRHIAFHPAKPVAYQLLERYGMVLVCRYNDGMLTPMEMQPTVSRDFVGLYNAAGEIFVHPNGKLLGVSNRGDNSLAMYRILEDGRLQIIGWTKEHVSVPRFYTFDATGTFLYCANIGESPKDRPMTKEADAIPGTGSISIFRVDPETGSLQYTGECIETAAPSCILFRKICS